MEGIRAYFTKCQKNAFPFPANNNEYALALKDVEERQADTEAALAKAAAAAASSSSSSSRFTPLPEPEATVKDRTNIFRHLDVDEHLESMESEAFVGLGLLARVGKEWIQGRVDGYDAEKAKRGGLAPFRVIWSIPDKADWLGREDVSKAAGHFEKRRVNWEENVWEGRWYCALQPWVSLVGVGVWFGVWGVGSLPSP